MNIIRWGVIAGVALATVAAAVTAPAAFAEGGVNAIGLSEHGNEISEFNTADPMGAKVIGMVDGVDDLPLIGIDYSPMDGELYGVGKRGHVYRIDDRTGSATEVGELSTALEGDSFDIDFTPSGDALRVITGSGQNVHQPFDADGPSGPTVTDGALSRTNITAMAYDDDGRLIDIDMAQSRLVVQDPDSGAITDLGEPGAFPEMGSTSNGLDIVGGDAFAVINLNHVHTLFSVNPEDGTAEKIDAFSGHVLDLALKR